MPVIYTKSALKKIKKDDLIYIFLCQQEMLSQVTNSYESYAMSHPCEMNCKNCGLTTTEDDLGISLDCGELTCEGCFEEGKSKSLKEENKELKETIQHCEGVMESDEDLEERLKAQHQIDLDDLKEEINKLKKEKAATNQRRATMYQFMSEYMEKAGCMGEYFDYIRENYPDKQKEAGVL